VPPRWEAAHRGCTDSEPNRTKAQREDLRGGPHLPKRSDRDPRYFRLVPQPIVLEAITKQCNDPDPAWWENLSHIAERTLVIADGPNSHLPQDQFAAPGDRIPDASYLTDRRRAQRAHHRPLNLPRRAAPFPDPIAHRLEGDSPSGRPSLAVDPRLPFCRSHCARLFAPARDVINRVQGRKKNCHAVNQGTGAAG